MRLHFTRVLRALVAVTVVTAVVAVPAAIADGGAPVALGTTPGVSGAFDETPSAWFVGLNGSAEAFRAEAKANGINVKEKFSYEQVWKGLSVSVARSDVAALGSFSSVSAIYPVLSVAAPDPGATVSPELATAIGMSGADQAQLAGWTGAGVKVAVMDTGVDWNHPDLGGCFGAGCRVAAGWDFVGDSFNADESSPAYNPATSPDPNPDDCNGHGTHVAGIVGASPAAAGGARGVAPGVTFGAYRVFGCEGSTTADIMLAAMERALADGMDILNMSIGSAFQTWPQYPTAVGADALVAAGMVVVTSIGNSGANGVYSASAPGVGRNVIGTASVENTHVSALTFRTPADRQVPYLEITETTDAPTSGLSAEVVYVGRGCTQSGPTWSLPAEDAYLANPSGKVALIDRGICTFDAKYQRAISAGAVGVITMNNASGLFAGGSVVDRGFFDVAISQQDGNALKAEIAAGPVQVRWTSDRVNAANPSAGLASTFTSYGMTAELDLKPDIAAPGGLIRSTYPLEKGGYAIVSGTSMASPHVAGSAALLMQARPTLARSMYRTVLQNNADPINFNAAIWQATHRQGAGMVDIDDTILSTSWVTPAKLALGEGNGPHTKTLTVTNNGTAAVTYNLSHRGALTTGGSTNAPSLFGPVSNATFSAPSVTVGAGGSATFDVTVTPLIDPALNRAQYGGYVILTPTNGSPPLRVPYAGFEGDYQSITVLTPTNCSLPALAKQGGSSPCTVGTLAGYTKQPAGATYTMTDTDLPRILTHFEHQARRAEFVVVNAATGVPIAGTESLVMWQDYLPRNSTADSFFVWTWDGKRSFSDNGKSGKLHRRAVPDGQYKLVMTVTKALAEDGNAAHRETWTSPTITIDRP